MRTKDLTQIAIMLSVIILLGFLPAIPLGFLPVPLLLQNIGIMLSGLILGKKRGTITLLLFLALIALGCPFLSGGRGGIAVFMGPTVGYLIGYPVGTFFIGWVHELVDARSQSFWRGLLVTFIFGVLLVNLLGILGLSFMTGTSFRQGLTLGSVFLIGDTLKAIVAVVVAYQLNPILQKSGNQRQAN